VTSDIWHLTPNIPFQENKVKKVSSIFGTRPEAIKLCPLVLTLKEHADFEPHVCVTGQADTIS